MKKLILIATVVAFGIGSAGVSSTFAGDCAGKCDKGATTQATSGSDCPVAKAKAAKAAKKASKKTAKPVAAL